MENQKGRLTWCLLIRRYTAWHAVQVICTVNVVYLLFFLTDYISVLRVPLNPIFRSFLSQGFNSKLQILSLLIELYFCPFYKCRSFVSRSVLVRKLFHSGIHDSGKKILQSHWTGSVFISKPPFIDYLFYNMFSIKIHICCIWACWGNEKDAPTSFIIGIYIG